MLLHILPVTSTKKSSENSIFVTSYQAISGPLKLLPAGKSRGQKAELWVKIRYINLKSNKSLLSYSESDSNSAVLSHFSLHANLPSENKYYYLGLSEVKNLLTKKFVQKSISGIILYKLLNHWIKYLFISVYLTQVYWNPFEISTTRVYLSYTDSTFILLIRSYLSKHI